MAREEDKNSIATKGRELWRALKGDSVDHNLIRRLLRDGAPVNFREPATERTPLSFVVCEKQRDERLLDILLENGANANLVDCFRLTPLHLAAEQGNLQTVKVLLRNPYSQADVHKRNLQGEKPLDVALRKERHDVVSYLLSNHQGELSSDRVVRTDGNGSNLTVIGNNIMVGDNNRMGLNQ